MPNTQTQYYIDDNNNNNEGEATVQNLSCTQHDNETAVLDVLQQWWIPDMP